MFASSQRRPVEPETCVFALMLDTLPETLKCTRAEKIVLVLADSCAFNLEMLKEMRKVSVSDGLLQPSVALGSPTTGTVPRSGRRWREF